MVSESWKSLEPKERKLWEDKAEKDKVRYEAEKAMYKGPWKVPSNKRKTKDPTAPKRPMSAFLAYSNSRRAALKREHPKSTNADLSRMLSKSWKELDPEERAGKSSLLGKTASVSFCDSPCFLYDPSYWLEYMSEERKLREQYKTEMSEWRKNCTESKRLEREEREVAAMEAAEAGQKREGVNANTGRTSHADSMDNKWMQEQRQQAEGQHHHQEQQVQLSGVANGGMFSNPYMQAAAVGGTGAGQGMDPRTLGASGNPYFANPFPGQGYMQGMQGVGNPALALFGRFYLW
jgi:HMG (high mobility group) box